MLLKIRLLLLKAVHGTCKSRTFLKASFLWEASHLKLSKKALGLGFRVSGLGFRASGWSFIGF